MSRLKQPLLALARRARLLPVLERLRFGKHWLQTRKSNANFTRRNPDFIAPPAWWMHDMYAHTDLAIYQETGVDHAAILDQFLTRHLGTGPHDVADWGCGMARMARHLGKVHRLVGFDTNPDAIDWISNNLSALTAKAHGPLPPLPAKNDAFDAVYSISVLTHIPQADARAWLGEIHRILRQGGLFLCTVHGAEQTRSLTSPERARFERGQPIYRGNVKRGSRNFATYLPENYLRDDLFGQFTVLQGPVQEFGQELWVLRKN